jgi:hypothetical protein
MSHLEPDDEAAGWKAERYAGGRMSEPEERDFEVAMLESSTLAEQVAAAQGLRAGVRELHRRGALNSLLRRTGFPLRQAALAAAVVLFIIGASVLFVERERSTPRPIVIASSLAQLNGPVRSVAASFILAHTRSQSQPTPLTLAHLSGAVALKILPETVGEGGDYRLTFEPIGVDTSSRITGDIRVRADSDGFVRVYLDPALIGPGDYRVSLIQGSHTERFLIRISFLP